MRPDWKGIYPALTTPFLPDETMDFQTMEKKVDDQIQSGANALILGGSLGEASTLTADEKLDLLRHVVAHTAGRVPIIMNVAESRTTEALAFVRRATDAGADGLMVLPPMRYKADADEVTAWFRAIAHETDLPILLYNNPVDYGIGLSLQQFEKLLNIPTIQAVKESTRDVTQVIRLNRAFGDRLKVLCGVDTLALESLMLGADGWVAGLVNAFPEETVAIYRLARQGDFDKARKIYSWFMPLLELDIHPKLVQYIKLAEGAAGRGTPYVRAPRLPLEETELRTVMKIIHVGLATRPTL
ncbi:MAG: dihydrodipicolinate synthase family protein [Saprospiraceae bacterium]|nr:dihydrodipicolinate synthase family protein [Saprospiraceae bacterium]